MRLGNIRQKETEINKIGNKRIQIVERNGDKLQELLTSSNPWGEEPCNRGDCLSCPNNTSEKGQCRETNIVYKNTCKLCKTAGENSIYIGETARSLYERGTEHVRDSLGGKEKRHIREHILLKHPEKIGDIGDTKVVAQLFEIKILKRHKTSLSRQLSETVMIKTASGTILNDKTEYNRCQIPILNVTKQQQPKIAQAEEERQETERQKIREKQLKVETEMRKKKDRDRTQKVETPKLKQNERPTKRAKRTFQSRDIRYYGVKHEVAQDSQVEKDSKLKNMSEVTHEVAQDSQMEKDS